MNTPELSTLPCRLCQFRWSVPPVGRFMYLYRVRLQIDGLCAACRRCSHTEGVTNSRLR